MNTPPIPADFVPVCEVATQDFREGQIGNLVSAGKIRARFASARGGLLVHQGDINANRPTGAKAVSASAAVFNARREFSIRLGAHEMRKTA